MAYPLSFVIKSLYIVYLAIQLQLAKSVGRYNEEKSKVRINQL